MLIGWFLISAADAERRSATAASALGGVRVADVMTADPQVAQGWITSRTSSTVSPHGPGRTPSPSWTVDGGLAGVVVTDLLARIPPGDTGGVRLDRVALAVPRSYLAAPEDPAGPLLARRPLGGEVLAVVLAAAGSWAW